MLSSRAPALAATLVLAMIQVYDPAYAADNQHAAQYWYYCAPWRSYYPTVQTSAEAWTLVPMGNYHFNVIASRCMVAPRTSPFLF